MTLHGTHVGRDFGWFIHMKTFSATTEPFYFWVEYDTLENCVLSLRIRCVTLPVNIADGEMKIYLVYCEYIDM